LKYNELTHSAIAFRWSISRVSKSLQSCSFFIVRLWVSLYFISRINQVTHAIMLYVSWSYTFCTLLESSNITILYFFKHFWFAVYLTVTFWANATQSAAVTLDRRVDMMMMRTNIAKAVIDVKEHARYLLRDQAQRRVIKIRKTELRTDMLINWRVIMLR